MALSSRTVAVVAILAASGPKMPESCNKMLGKSPAPTADPTPPPSSTTTTTTATSAPTSTTPPIWQPPEPPQTATAAAVKDAGPSDSDLAKAALDKKEYKKVRTLLKTKVETGKGSPEDASMLLEACTRLKDKVCIEKAKNPPPPGP